MNKRATSKLLLALSFICAALCGSASAQVSFSNPGASDISLVHCDDYFRTVWGTAIDMSDANHGPLFDIPAG